jgi:nitrous oxidase accessory protein NosD
VQGAAARQTVPLTAGMVIDRSRTIRPGRYTLPSADLNAPAIIIRGENITVDFSGAELAGDVDDRAPDSFSGLGLLIDGGQKVTVKNAVIRGFKVAILARKSPDLRLSHNDLSHNWKQRLYSGVEKESLVDWMSYHQNENDEWLRYGAGIYLAECDRAQIDHNTVLQGQNGLMVRHSTGLAIWNNTFQFLSSIGIGLYRVTGSTIMHNRIDWCVRGYSHGFYNRGQDSAGLLMYEQSSGNRVAYNSVTHSGDGLFLWAGQSTMDTGQGGSNDNLFYENDFSHAPTNGIEATFSRNTFLNNRVDECWHGVWGGYSWESKWIGNRFANNTEAIAIEHGQNNEILKNRFDGDATAIRLWQNAAQDPNWGYPKSRDTRSRAYVISDNVFTGNKVALDIRSTEAVVLRSNSFDMVATTMTLSGSASDLLFQPPDARVHSLELGKFVVATPAAPAPPPPSPFSDGIDPMIKDPDRRGRQFIIVDEWGPYDWKSPKLRPAGRSDELPLKLRVLGPEGAWSLASVRGAVVSAKSGRVPGEIVVTPASAAPVDFDLSLEYRGAAVVSPRGIRTAAGAPNRFSYSRFFVPIDWRIRFFEHAETTDPVKRPDAFAKLIAGTPIKTSTSSRLDYISGGTIEEGVPRDRFALVAEGSAILPPGEYTLQVISDDGVRVWVDDALLIDSWDPHESKVDRVPITGGQRRFKVEYYEAGGFAELRFEIQRR